MVPYHRARSVPAAPSGDARAQPQFGIVAVREEVLIEAADFVQHLLPIHGGAAVSRTIVYHNCFETRIPLPGQRSQTRSQQLPTVPVHNHYADQATMLTSCPARARTA